MSDASDSKGLGCIMAIIVFVILGIIGLIISCDDCGGMSQYEKDYYSSRNKTWDEMTPGEREVTRDEIEWMIEQQNK